MSGGEDIAICEQHFSRKRSTREQVQSFARKACERTYAVDKIRVKSPTYCRKKTVKKLLKTRATVFTNAFYPLRIELKDDIFSKYKVSLHNTPLIIQRIKRYVHHGVIPN